MRKRDKKLGYILKCHLAVRVRTEGRAMKREERLMDISKLHMRALANDIAFFLVILGACDVSAVSFIIIHSSSSQQC